VPRFVIEVAYVFIVNDLLVAEPKEWTIIILTLSDTWYTIIRAGNYVLRVQIYTQTLTLTAQ
jgi:hypothetical protein